MEREEGERRKELSSLFLSFFPFFPFLFPFFLFFFFFFFLSSSSFLPMDSWQNKGPCHPCLFFGLKATTDVARVGSDRGDDDIADTSLPSN